MSSSVRITMSCGELTHVQFYIRGKPYVTPGNFLLFVFSPLPLQHYVSNLTFNFICQREKVNELPVLVFWI